MRIIIEKDGRVVATMEVDHDEAGAGAPPVSAAPPAVLKAAAALGAEDAGCAPAEIAGEGPPSVPARWARLEGLEPAPEDIDAGGASETMPEKE